MSFVSNDIQQLSINDPYYQLSDREKRFLNKSWATYFAEDIFPKINEQRFAVLYSDNQATRPSTPINVTVGALLIKEMRNQTDDDILESLLFDYRYQYALHTSSMDTQPMSDRTLGRFRARVYEYELQTGIDLIQEEIEALSNEMAIMMKIDGSIRRMDSMMIAANIKKMSRLELLYTCLANFIKEIEDTIDLPENLKHYIEKDDRNQVIYHNKSDDTADKIQVVLDDCHTILSLCSGDYEESSNYILLRRVLAEQTIKNDDGTYRLRTKADGGMTGKILQNPSDPDATYREKAGKQHRGYSANVVESVGKNGSIVTHYDFNQNIHSDSDFAKETITKMGKQDDEVTLVADGAFASDENTALAKENNIDLVTTNLTGRESKDICADFEFSEDGKKVIACPAGHAPHSCSYNSVTGQCAVSFDAKHCKGCPHLKECHPKVRGKRYYRMVISINSKRRAIQQRFRKSEEFSKLTKIRNGIETVPSYLRRKHNVDHMPAHSMIRLKHFFGLKIGGSNINKFCKYKRSLDKCTQNIAFA